MNYYFHSVYASRSLLATLFDGIAILASFALAWIVVAPPIEPLSYVGLSLLFMVMGITVLFFNDGYTPKTLGDGARTALALLTSSGITLIVGVSAYYVVHVPEGVTPTLMGVGAAFVPLFLTGRSVLRLMFGTSWMTTRVLVIGATDLGLRVARMLHERRDSGIRMVGFLSDDLALHHHGGRFADFPIIAQPHELEKVLRERPVDTIVVASKDRHEHFPEQTLMLCRMHGKRVESGVSFLERLSGRVHMRDLRASYLIFGGGFANGIVYRMMRRALDVVGAAVLLTLTAPLIALAAIAIKLDSSGPVLFRQERLGKDDVQFVMNKLRSMRVDADADADDEESQNDLEGGAEFKATAADDDRITRVGYLIRRTRLDELPQLWNVLKGDMSLVGPRAERPEFVERLSQIYPYYTYRTTVRPGITGWAQTRYGYVNNVEQYEEKLALDLYYLKYRGLALDLMILAQTIKTVLHFRGL